MLPTLPSVRDFQHHRPGPETSKATRYYRLIQFFQRNPVPKTSYILFNTQDSQNYPFPESSKSVLKTINIIFVPKTFNTILVPITLSVITDRFYRADSLRSFSAMYFPHSPELPILSSTADLQHYPVPQTSNTTQYYRPPTLSRTTYLQHYPVPQTSNTTQYHRH